MTDTAINDCDDIFTAEAYPHLAAAGYEFFSDGINLPGCDFEVIEQSEVDDLEDALEFVEYLSGAIDRYQGVETDKPYNTRSTDLFDELLYALPADFTGEGELNETPDKWKVFFLIAIRCFQREDKLEQMRTALGLYMIYDNGTFTGRDLISAIAPDLVALHDKIHAAPEAKAA